MRIIMHRFSLHDHTSCLMSSAAAYQFEVRLHRLKPSIQNLNTMHKIVVFARVLKQIRQLRSVRQEKSREKAGS